MSSRHFARNTAIALAAGVVLISGLAWYFLIYDTTSGRCHRGDLGACIVESLKMGQSPGSVQAVRMLGSSMYATLHDGDVVEVDRNAYIQRAPQRGDIIDFKPPDEASRDFIKRIIGLPGERIHITNSVVYINGQVLNEPYLPEKWTYNNNWPASGQDQLIPPQQYFVLGDNRNHSSDSRTFGFIDLGAILGKMIGR
jgi:signal peptidase I